MTRHPQYGIPRQRRYPKHLDAEHRQVLDRFQAVAFVDGEAWCAKADKAIGRTAEQLFWHLMGEEPFEPEDRFADLRDHIERSSEQVKAIRDEAIRIRNRDVAVRLNGKIEAYDVVLRLIRTYEGGYS